jgi:hypothetical protein
MKSSRRRSSARPVLAAGLALVLCAGGIARAASPVLSSVLPRGGQRGTEVQVTLTGDRLKDAKDLLLYQPGLTLKKLDVVDAKRVNVLLAVAADAPLGEHPLRVRTATGISELDTFWVGPLPCVAEKEPNNDPAKAQPVELNRTIEGAIANEDLDCFRFTAKKGQPITVEVEGLRLGGTMFDPRVEITDASGAEVAVSDDSALLLQDPVASFVAPADGEYAVKIRDSSYGGGDGCRYRLHVGTFPQPTMVYPAGGQVGQELAAEFVGDVSGPIRQTLRLPAAPSDGFRAWAQRDGAVAPTGNLIRVSPFPNTLEAEPNNDPSTATPAASEVPLALNGILATKGDADVFRFKAKKDQPLDVQVFARRLRSPVDSVLTIRDATGKTLASNDDAGGQDSGLRFQPPADGEYLVRVTDHLGNGGPDFVYRVEITPVGPELALTIPLVAANSQERQTVVVPRGNRYATLVRATRSEFGGSVKVRATGLPAGVTATERVAPDGVDTVPVVFEATADAPSSAALADVAGVPEDATVKAPSEFTQTADLVVFGNQVAYYQAKVNKLAVAVADEAPFKLRIVQPKVPLVQSGSMQLKVVADRKDGFTAPIKLSMLFKPPGVSGGDVTIPEKANEAALPINASADARLNDWKICVVGSADNNGAVWVSSQLADLTVAPSMLTGKIEMVAGERGKPVQVLCKLTQQQPFEGKAKIELLGLPPNTTAEPKEITAGDREIVFDVQTTDKSPTGQQKSLFCAVTVTKEGEPIRQSIAGGGVLRIDAPSKSAAGSSVAAVAPNAKAPAKPLSRLEKLRQEQAQREPR